MLRFTKQVQILTQTFLLEFFEWNKSHCRRVHAVTQSCWRWTIIKNVPEVRIGVHGSHLCSLHSVSLVRARFYVFRLERLAEAGPAAIRIELVERTKERLAGDDIDINSRLVVVPVRVVKWRFRAILLRDLILFGCQPRA